MTTLRIETDLSYEPVLNRYNCSDSPPEVMHLYEVHTFDPTTGTWLPIQYCLSPDAEGAIDQCSPFPAGSDNRDKSVGGSYALQKPMRVRGWGNNEY